MLDGHRNLLAGNSNSGTAGVEQTPTAARVSDEIVAGIQLGRSRLEKSHRRHKWCYRERSESPSSSEEDSSSSGEEHPEHGKLRDFRKRRKHLQKPALGRDVPGGLFAFAEDATLAEADLPPALRITRQRIAAYKQDESATLEYILSTPGRPELPKQQWRAVMLGQYVDFEKIHEDAIHGWDSETVRIRDFLVWSISWVRYAKAVTMVFPNRAAELADHQQHITDLFGAYVPDVHSKIIAYDIAVRKRAAKQGNLLLTDHTRFDDIFQELLHPQGVGASHATRPSKFGKPAMRKGKTSKKCRRFNAGRCPDNASSCRYRHACTECSSPDHGANECEKKIKHE
jgi:hypothetical protein